MIAAADFIAWVQQQDERRPLMTHIRRYIDEMGLSPTRQETKTLINRMYVKLRLCGGHEYPTIDYTPSAPRAPRDEGTFNFSESQDLQVISDTIALNGFAFPQTTTSLEVAHVTHAKASPAQQKALGAVVKSFTNEIALMDVKVNNAEELARRDRELAADRAAQLEETRKDKAFLQSMLTKRGGGNVV